MGESTPAGFAAKCDRYGGLLTARPARVVALSSEKAKTAILASAMSHSTRRLRARPSWVKVRLTGLLAEVELWGGFAYLLEKGSYRHPGGWQIAPRGLGKAKRGRLRRAQGLGRGMAGPVNVTGAGVNTTGLLANKATGFAAMGPVHHPSKPAHPFWLQGTEAANRAVATAWFDEMGKLLKEVF